MLSYRSDQGWGSCEVEKLANPSNRPTSSNLPEKVRRIARSLMFSGFVSVLSNRPTLTRVCVGARACLGAQVGGRACVCAYGCWTWVRKGNNNRGCNRLTPLVQPKKAGR
jgi:hypothetical protein